MMGKGLGRLYLRGGGGGEGKDEVEQRRKLSKPQSSSRLTHQIHPNMIHLKLTYSITYQKTQNTT